ncbi:MAG TPA: hypothetical protein VKR31_12380 [Rhizomicrobium sp.]|nr:hypothetical protein [Rhizomicrobium sp.]
MRTVRNIVTTTTCIFLLAGCGGIDMQQTSPTVAGSSEPSGLIFKCEQDQKALTGASAALTAQIETASSSITASAPGDLSNDPVVRSLVAAVASTAVQAQRNAMAMRGDASATAAADAALTRIGTPGTLSASDFKNFAQNLAKSVFDPVVNGTSSNAGSNSSFWTTLVTYYDQYFQGKFVDRFGNKLSPPAAKGSVNDEEISGVVAIFVEALADSILKTPVWKDSSGNYYPGASKDEPTVLEAGILSAPAGLVTNPGQCGMTTLKTRAVKYFSDMASARAGMVGGLVSGSFGGIHFGLGVMGKISIGDNQTLQVIIKTALSKAAGRAAEHASYLVLSQVGYSSQLDQAFQKNGNLPADLVAYLQNGK